MAESFFIQEKIVYVLLPIEFSGIMVIDFEVPDLLQNVEHCRRIVDEMQHICT